MNKERRKQIAKAQDILDDAKCKLAHILDEEEQYLENMVESFFNGEKGAIAQENINDLGYCIEGILDIVDTLQSVIDRKHI